MSQIERPGTYLGTITESTLGQTKTGLPQWIARLTADKLYADNAELLEFYKLKEAAYVEWPGEEGITAFLVLFNDKGPLKNYDQLQVATGWDGQDFQTLTDLVGKRLLFRVEEDTYNGKTSLKVNWVDAEDAPPERTLKPVAPEVVKDLNSKFLSALKKPAAPAKPATAAKPNPTKPVAPAPTAAATPATVAPSAETPATTTAPAANTVTPAKRPPGRPKKETPVPPPPPPADEPQGLPVESTKDQAWEYINTPAVKGDNADAVIEDAWIAATSEVGPDRHEDTFTGKDWARVLAICVKDLGGK